MLLELHIFNKESEDRIGLANWNLGQGEIIESGNFSYSTGKFKSKLYRFKNIINELNFIYKETLDLEPYFDDFDIEVEVIKNHHHLLNYCPSEKKLQIDSAVKAELIPIYLYAFYYASARKEGISEEECHKELGPFLDLFNEAEFEKLKNFYTDSQELDAGNHFYEFLNKNKSYQDIQLLRNRTLVGKTPWDITKFEDIRDFYKNDAFSGEAINAYYEAFLEYYNKDFAELYYEKLLKALRIIGLKVVTQRGSRVAHEQGPLLINSSVLSDVEDLELHIKKLESNINNIKSDLRSLAKFDLVNDNEYKRKFLNIDFLIDELFYLANLENPAKARFEKVLRNIDKSTKDLFEYLETKLDMLNESEEDLARVKLDLFDKLHEANKSFKSCFFNLEDALHSSTQVKKVAIVLIQRPSLRSGHFIPRFVLGENLYLETDDASEEHRLKAIPYNFVAPSFENVIESDAFFENASVSISTDKNTGEPKINWDNAESLAIDIAESIYYSIEAAGKRGGKFHYQLETTLFGPLIELYKSILESELTNIASLEYASNPPLESESAQMSLVNHSEQVKTLIKSYNQEILEAAEFVFNYYLLENHIQEHMLREALSREEAILELILTMHDVQLDIAKFCILKRQSRLNLEEIDQSKLLEKGFSYTEAARYISNELSTVNDFEAKQFIKKYIKLPASTARKEYLSKHKEIKRKIICSNKKINAYKHFNFTVAPSRIDFGKHVVASITTLMGRMLGADDNESLKAGKEYIDLVSKTDNHIFDTGSEAGTAKVIENTCRAMQYAKTIAFQGVFQNFNTDGQNIRTTINSRNSADVGVHVIEHGTMAATGYCITKEPLFILLSLAMKSDDLLKKLGVVDIAARNEIKTLMHSVVNRKNEFISDLEWQSFAYDEVTKSPSIQKYLTESGTPWIPNVNALITLFNHLGDSQNIELTMQKTYANFASSLVRYSRMINETGIIQRIQITNDAIRRAQILSGNKKPYGNLCIALNAAYKGNVSDERENANQYIMALLLKQKQYIKNLREPSLEEMVDLQIKSRDLPQEIRIVDPLVDPNVFMSGELKARAEQTEQKLINISQAFIKPLSQEVIKASVVSYGSDPKNWRVLQKRMSTVNKEEQNKINEKLAELEIDLKYLETYHKGFAKNPYIGYQGVDVIQLNANHDILLNFVKNLVLVKATMQTRNSDSLLVLVDNPQQGKRPLLDYDKSLEWLALGGTIASHMISGEKYESWRKRVNSEKDWAREFLRISLNDSSTDELKAFTASFQQIKERIDIRREFITSKYHEAKEIKEDIKSLKRYKEWNLTLARVSKYSSHEQISFSDWLVLGGRWLLNGAAKKDIDYVIKMFNDSENLKNLNKQDFKSLELYINQSKPLPIKQQKRIVSKTGSTKESDLLVSSAADGLEFRASQAQASKSIAVRYSELQSYDKDFPIEDIDKVVSNINAEQGEREQTLNQLIELWDNEINKIDSFIFKDSKEYNPEKQRSFARLLKILEKTALCFIHKYYKRPDKHDIYAVRQFVTQRDGYLPYIEAIFGDHRKDGGLFQRLAEKAVEAQQNDPNPNAINIELFRLSRLGEMFNVCFLLFLTLEVNDENEMINQLSIFFDQYLNVHEEDYPPYMFHRLCAGDSYGFSEGYAYNPSLRQKMFEISCKTGSWIYKYIHHTVSNRTTLKKAKQEYKDCLIGDFDRGIIPICYQHETISIEERLWDCIRSIRNFVRNNHDKHPLPIIIKGPGATLTNLFKSKHSVAAEHDLVWITGLANPGKHSWDVNCVFRSPILREIPIEDNAGSYVNVSVFTPYLTNNGEIKQIYTAFKPEIIESGNFDFIAPFDEKPRYELNEEGFVHARVVLEAENGKLPKPHITMSAHTHPQYIDKSTLEWGAPEAWSYLSMKQMYSKTEVPNILRAVGLEPLSQIEFNQNEFSSKDEIKDVLLERLEKAGFDHIYEWILKASKDSGGRGVTNNLNLRKDMDKIIDFIFLKTKTDDVVMQEFLHTNAKALTSPDFIQSVKDSFVEDGIVVDQSTPEEPMYFTTRSFQSVNGIRGYLYSVNVGSVAVNAGQGAKMFYGEPSYIMPLFIAGKIQRLMDEQGELILKQAIPKHAEEFAKKNKLSIKGNPCGFNNTNMINGLFDYIPYIFAIRKDKDGSRRNYKIACEDNAEGGLDYFYDYHGKKIIIASGYDHKSSLLSLENAMRETISDENRRDEELIDIELAKIEFNSGLGQANLLQRVIEETNPSNKNMFLEWTMDLGMIGRMYQLQGNGRESLAK